jgi:hypothetical protein
MAVPPHPPSLRLVGLSPPGSGEAPPLSADRVPPTAPPLAVAGQNYTIPDNRGYDRANCPTSDRRHVFNVSTVYQTPTFSSNAMRILASGWHIAYEERAVAYTEAPEAFVDLVKQRYRWTRGILQALRKRSALLASPRHGRLIWLSLSAMLFESVLWPAMNVLGNLLFSLVALSAANASGVFYWWVLVTMLDVAAALYAVGIEGEDLRLVPYAVLYRFMFITMIDVAKLFATVEEVARPHDVGKLERAGRI